jgi:hypothetical protein
MMSPMSGRYQSDSVDDLNWNRWTVSGGICGRIAAESVDGFRRIMHTSFDLSERPEYWKQKKR